MPSEEAYNIKTLVESCKSFYVANSPNDFDKLIPQVINILKNDAILSTCKDDILKCLEYYARCILKNREKLKDFTKRYHETCKYIIKLDFIKGYYVLLVLTKCIIDSKTPATNVKYVDKFYYKFSFLLKNSNFDNKKSNQNRIAAIKEAYTTYKKEINLVKPIKRGRDLAQEDMTADDIILRKELKKYKAMIKEPKKHIPKFLYYLPDDVNMKILSFLNNNDFLELRCSNSLVNRFVSNTYLPKMEIFYKNILIDNDESFQKFYGMISVFKARSSPIEKLVFDFDTLKLGLSLTIDLKTIQQMINIVRVKELCIINHSWTLISMFPLNLVGKAGHKIERLTIKIGKIINENYRFLENSFLLLTAASLISLSIDYINMVYIKETARIGIKSSSQAIQCYDGSIMRRQETTDVESLEIISFLDMAMFPLLNKYTKNKVFMEIFIKFDEIFTNLKEITLKNFSIYNMNSLFGYIRANPLEVTKLELLRIPSLPQLPKLFLLLKDLNNLKTFSLHSSSNLRYSFTSMNSFILIKDVYDTSQVSDDFLERFFIIPSWPKLEELTLIETSINKPILENLLNQNMKFLCLNDNLNLKYMPAERVAEFNPNVDITKFFITDMKKFHELMPNLEVFSLNNLGFDAHCSYITGITNSFFKDLFDMNLKTLDVSMNQSFAMRIYDFLTYINMQANEEGLSVGNLIYDDFFGQDKKSKDGFEEKMKMLNLVKGFVSNKVKQFKNDNEYVCWYRTCVLDKYKCI